MDSCTVTRHRILHGKTCTTTNGSGGSATTDTSLNAFKQLHFFCLHFPTSHYRLQVQTSADA
jgi:hypothetical protein